MTSDNDQTNRPAVFIGRHLPDEEEHRIDFIDEEGVSCTIDNCLHLRNHSPTGPSWGYGGSGPAQASLAILVHALKQLPAVYDRDGSLSSPEDVAQGLYQEFKRDVVSSLGQGVDFRLTLEDVLTWFRASHGDYSPGWDQRENCPHGQAWLECGCGE